ncbi:MAG: hypothetical protein R3202_01085 [Candidatus Competibacterales bacterium]|nr:hypothetical protein [Candidatus Competibacterales bacterium]
MSALTCPFCALLCDDLQPAGEGAVPGRACPRAAAAFRRRFEVGAAEPCQDGRPVSPEQALEAAAALLARARRPLIGGLRGDVAAQQAALELAEQCRGVVDHAATGLHRTLVAWQTDGWLATSLSEIRNRADLVVAVGYQVFEHCPRLAERVLSGDTLSGRPPVRVLLGPAEVPDAAAPADTVPVAAEALVDAVGLLRILCRGGPLPNRAAGLPLEPLRRLAGRLAEAAYPVLVWSAAEPAAAAAVDQLQGLARELNEAGHRSMTLGLTEPSAQSAVQVGAWRSGFPPRTAFRPEPEYDPWRYASERLLAENAVDAVLWLAALDPDSPLPASSLPTVVLGHPALRPERPPDVYIPVGVPAIDHPGVLFRTDGVALPLPAAGSESLPAASGVLHRLRRRIAEMAA